MRVRRRSCCGSGISSAVTMQGPSGADDLERLAPPHLVPGEALFVPAHLPLARGHVVDDGVAEDVVERALDRNMAPAFPDHDCELGFRVELPREALVVDDRVSRPDHAVGGLHEEFRLLAGDRRVRLLLVVVGVVAAAAQHRRGDDRRGEPDGCERPSAFAGCDRVARRIEGGGTADDQIARVGNARKLDDGVALECADTHHAVGSESNDFHRIPTPSCPSSAPPPRGASCRCRGTGRTPRLP